MKLVKPSVQIDDWNGMLRPIENGGRTAWKSEDKITEGSAAPFIERIRGYKHDSVLEHGVISIRFIFDIGIGREALRHRHMSPTQESTRYCAYQKGKFGNQTQVIDPFFFDPAEAKQDVYLPQFYLNEETQKIEQGSADPEAVQLNKFDVWMLACLYAEWAYMQLTSMGASAQEARNVLNLSTKSEAYITANVREWIHILRLRTAKDAHPQIRQIMVPLGHKLAEMWPVLFSEFLEAQHPSPATVEITKP